MLKALKPEQKVIFTRKTTSCDPMIKNTSNVMVAEKGLDHNGNVTMEVRYTGQSKAVDLPLEELRRIFQVTTEAINAVIQASNRHKGTPSSRHQILRDLELRLHGQVFEVSKDVVIQIREVYADNLVTRYW